MPRFNFICEVCGKPGRAYRLKKPPRFCNNICRASGRVIVSRPTKWLITTEIHEQIKKLYQARVGMNKRPVIKDYADKIKYPKWKIIRYAQKQGWATRGKKEPHWSKKELEILERSGHRSPEIIRQHLKNAGFNRTVTGIVVKRKRMRIPSNLQGYSACQVAECFGVDVHSVLRWIRLGWLKANRRGTKRRIHQGGDIYFIRNKWIRDFILEYLPEIDIRKVDKYWFVDLLAGDEECGPGAFSIVKETEIENEHEADEYKVPAIARAVGI